jgi:Fic family protein
MEEAITSSHLEGATTTREVAKEMLRSGRPAKNRDELMILNNYRAMNFMRENRGNALTPEMVLRLHQLRTQFCGVRRCFDVPQA